MRHKIKFFLIGISKSTFRYAVFSERLFSFINTVTDLPFMCSTLKTKLCRANTQRMIRGLSNLEPLGFEAVSGLSEV